MLCINALPTITVADVCTVPCFFAFRLPTIAAHSFLRSPQRCIVELIGASWSLLVHRLSPLCTVTLDGVRNPTPRSGETSHQMRARGYLYVRVEEEGWSRVFVVTPRLTEGEEAISCIVSAQSRRRVVSCAEESSQPVGFCFQ